MDIVKIGILATVDRLLEKVANLQNRNVLVDDNGANSIVARLIVVLSLFPPQHLCKNHVCSACLDFFDKLFFRR